MRRSRGSSTRAAGAPRAPTSLAPDFARCLDDQLELRPLLVVGEIVPLERRREAALRRQAELLERHVARRGVDPPLELVLRLESAALRRDEPEHDLLRAFRQEAQRLEAAGTLVVPLHEEAVDLELAEERLGDVVVAALGRPRRAEVAAAHVRRDAHAL